MSEPIRLFARDLVRRTLIAWLCIEALLGLGDVFLNRFAWVGHRSVRQLFNMASEDGLGTWFSATQLLLVAGVIWLIRTRAVRGAAGRTAVVGWTILAAFFGFMALDDAAGIHERVGSAVEDRLFPEEDADDEEIGDVLDEGGLLQRAMGAFPSYAWQVVFAPLYGGMGLFMLLFFWGQLRDRRVLPWLIAGLSCYVLAVGMDFVEGLPRAQTDLAASLGVDRDSLRHYLKLIEELLEMVGTTLFLCGFLAQLSARDGGLTVVLASGGQDASRAQGTNRSSDQANSTT